MSPDRILAAHGLQFHKTLLEIQPFSPLVNIDLVMENDGQKLPTLDVVLPSCMPEWMTPVSRENAIRVSGEAADLTSFAAGGMSTAFRLDALLRAHFGKGFSEFSPILDWGIGAGRVALPVKRLLAPKSDFVGTDVDAYNIEFGKKNCSDINFMLSPFYPPLPFFDEQFEMAYAISVFTHLTEGAQHVWLKELRRVVKPGAPVIATIHGAYAIWQTFRYDPLALDETVTFGINDRRFDSNLGPKLDDPSYYRATFHTPTYVEKYWSEYFDIIAHYPCANVLVQDIVVMRAR